MNKLKKIFDAYFIDLDGTARDDAFLHTTLGYFYGISKKNVEAIIEKNKKVPVIISTGRDKNYVAKILPHLNIKYGICQNGSIIIDKNGKVLKELYINKDIGYSIIKFAHSKGLAVRVNDDQAFHGGGFRITIIAKIFKEKRIKEKINKMHPKYSKITLFGRSRKTMTKIFKEIKAKNLPISVVTSTRGYGIEITDKNATKGTAALWVCKQLKVNPKKAVHIGDTMNDTPGFTALGAGIVMGNASKEVKSYASFITTHYKKDGLINAFNGNITPNPIQNKRK